MDESTRALILMVLVLVLLIAVALVSSRFLLKRAATGVIKMFRKHNALNAASALTPEDLGFKKRGILQFGLMRDYKPMALDLLMKGDMVQQTEDGRLFLSEEHLAQTAFEIRPHR